MRRVHIVGGKNHGKTGLVVELVREFIEKGLKVGTIKHTHHHHELDIPGKDSHRHRESGALVVGILSPSMNAVFWRPQESVAHEGPAGSVPDSYQAFEPSYANCDLVLVEGNLWTTALRVEVWRAAVGTSAYALNDSAIAAVITDDPISLATPVWPRSSVDLIARSILNLLEMEPESATEIHPIFGAPHMKV